MTPWTFRSASFSDRISGGSPGVNEGVAHMASQLSRIAAVLFATSCLVFPGQVLAQSADNSSRAPVYLEADHVQDLPGGQEGYLARGNVRVRQEDRTLFADELEYHPSLDRVVARGNVIIFGQGDFPQYADEVELDSALSTGLALGFATMLEANGRVAAAAAIRRENGSLQLEDAYYTACELCADGSDEPSWRIRAREVVQDTEDEMVYYRDARLEVMGVPVLYAPVFAHADPSTERHSGFLFPKVGSSSRLGFVYEQPYYWAISPSQDVTIAPRYMGNVNPLLSLEYRKRFWSGTMALEGSYTREFEIDSDGERFGTEEDRWHVFGGGEFALSPEWRWGFGIQRASDDLHLRRYDFSEIDKDRGAPLQTINRNLVSQLYLEGRTDNSLTTGLVASYQSLQTGINDDTLPEIAPMLEYRRVFDLPSAELGRINVSADAVMLTRKQGADYARVSVESDWRGRFITSPGIVLEPYAYGRVDQYSLDDIPVAGGGTASDDFSRELGLAGLDISYPLYRAGEHLDWIVEPVVAATIASDDPNAARILNEDSQLVELDESLVFAPVRANGNDLWEEGQRVSYGVRTTAQWGESNSARLFVGQSQRVDGVAVYNPSSGLFEENSDYIVAGEVNLGDFTATVDTRLDAQDYDVNRLGATLGYVGNRVSGSVRYTDISDDASGRPAQREIVYDASLRMTDHWSLIARGIEDLDAETSRRRELGVQYNDECTQLEIVYERQDMGIASLGPSESIQVRITLFTLGSFAEE